MLQWDTCIYRGNDVLTGTNGLHLRLIMRRIGIQCLRPGMLFVFIRLTGREGLAACLTVEEGFPSYRHLPTHCLPLPAPVKLPSTYTTLSRSRNEIQASRFLNNSPRNDHLSGTGEEKKIIYIGEYRRLTPPLPLNACSCPPTVPH